ncbi:MAG TPA: recombinase family protein [Symbiobacteriaceae bacterium]|jgi:site-specific DNA recombinase
MRSETKSIRPDRVAIYIRWSTEDQGDGTTLAVQQEGCGHYVLSQGWQVTSTLVFIDDGCSGGTLNRPKLDELRQAIKAGAVDCVVVYKLDRLSRSVMDTVNLVLGEWEGHCHVKSAREPIDTATAMGKQFFYMLVSYAEWERGVIKERTFSGKLRRAREGRSPGGPVPFGYRLSGQAGILEVDPDRAGIVRRIFGQYLAEEGTYRIAGDLNRDGIPSPTGRKWHINTLLKMLKNPLYAGRLVYGRVTVNPRRQRDQSEPWYLKNPEPIRTESRCPAIIPAAEFDRVQALLARRSPTKVGVRALGSDHLLTGLLKCRCGAAMIAHTSVSSTKKPYAYYACQGKKGRGRGGCDGGLIPQTALDGAMRVKLAELLQGEESYRHFLTVRWASVETQIRETAERRRQAGKTLDELAGQSRRLNADYRKGEISASLYQENRREIDAEAAQLAEQAAYLERLEHSLAGQLHQRDAVAELFDLARRWDDLAVAQRKYVLRNLVDSVEAFKQPGTPEVALRVCWKFGGE